MTNREQFRQAMEPVLNGKDIYIADFGQHCRVSFRDMADVNQVALSYLFADEPHRRKGLATAALSRIIAAADANGIELHATVFDAADLLVRWYARHGFTGTGRTMKREPQNAIINAA